MKHGRLYWVLITIALCLLSVLATVAVCYWHRTIPRDRCSDLFLRYADTPGIQAAFIRDMHIDHSVTVAATLLTATDSASWCQLMADFDLSENPSMGVEPSTVFLHYPKAPEDIRRYPDAPVTDLLAISPHLRSVCLFHINSIEQVNAIMLYKIREIGKNK